MTTYPKKIDMTEEEAITLAIRKALNSVGLKAIKSDEFFGTNQKDK